VQSPRGTRTSFALLSAQFGQQRSELVDGQLKEILARNRMLRGKKIVGRDGETEWQRVGEELAQCAICPAHVREFMSTTRNVD
jgi:hypothetical protein